MGCIARLGCLAVLAIAAVVGWFTRDLWLPERYRSHAAVASNTAWKPLTNDGAERTRVALDKLSQPRGQVFQTDLNDATCGTNAAKIGPDADGEPGGCDNVRLVVPVTGPIQANYFRTAD